MSSDKEILDAYRNGIRERMPEEEFFGIVQQAAPEPVFLNASEFYNDFIKYPDNNTAGYNIVNEGVPDEFADYARQQIPDGHLIEGQFSDNALKNIGDALKYTGVSDHTIGPVVYSKKYKDNNDLSDDEDVAHIVNVPKAEFFDPQNISEKLTGRSDIEAAPGTPEKWAEYIAQHEADHIQHWDDPENIREVFQGNKNAEILEDEVQADRAANSWAREHSHTEMVQALDDYRSIIAYSGDHIHATSPFIGSPEDRARELKDMDEWAQAAREFKATMFDKVVDDISLKKGEKNVEDAFENRPTEVLDKIEARLEEGAYDDTPKEKEYIEEFVDGYRERMKLDKDAQSDPENKKDTAKQQAAEDTTDKNLQSTIKDPDKVEPSTEDVQLGNSRLAKLFNGAAKDENIATQQPAVGHDGPSLPPPGMGIA